MSSIYPSIYSSFPIQWIKKRSSILQSRIVSNNISLCLTWETSTRIELCMIRQYSEKSLGRCCWSRVFELQFVLNSSHINFATFAQYNNYNNTWKCLRNKNAYKNIQSFASLAHSLIYFVSRDLTFRLLTSWAFQKDRLRDSFWLEFHSKNLGFSWHRLHSFNQPLAVKDAAVFLFNEAFCSQDVWAAAWFTAASWLADGSPGSYDWSLKIYFCPSTSPTWARCLCTYLKTLGLKLH